MNNHKQFAKVFWTAQDLKESRPDWSEDQCNAFLDSIGEEITDAMIQAGWAVIDSKLSTGE